MLGTPALPDASPVFRYEGHLFPNFEIQPGAENLFVPSRENPADFPSRSMSDADCKLSPRLETSGSGFWPSFAGLDGLVLQCSV